MLVFRLCLLLLFSANVASSGVAHAQRAARNVDGDLADALVAAAIERTQHRVRYDGRYRQLDYPGGDVPDDIGVCTDLVVRAYRAVGIDLQREVHEDMAAHFEVYPRRWGLSRPDRNIDHRRVPNLQVFFSRKGMSLGVSADPADYKRGDLVTWTLPGNLPHIGIVAGRRSRDGLRPTIVHNIGGGPVHEDALFAHPVSGHYRYVGPEATATLRGWSRPLPSRTSKRLPSVSAATQRASPPW